MHVKIQNDICGHDAVGSRRRLWVDSWNDYWRSFSLAVQLSLFYYLVYGEKILLSLLLLANLNPIQCPRWLPGTNTTLPAGVQLSPRQELNNRLRCYCEIVVPKEEECKRNYSIEACEDRTRRWINENFPNFGAYINNQGNTGTTRRLRMISIEP